MGGEVLNNKIKSVSLNLLLILFIPALLAGCVKEAEDKAHTVSSKDKNYELTVPSNWLLVEDDMKSDYSIVASMENDAEGVVFEAQSKEYTVNKNGKKVAFDGLSEQLAADSFPGSEIKEISKDPIDDMKTVSYSVSTEDHYYYVVSVMEDDINYYITASGTGIEKDFNEEKFLEINKTLDVKESISLITDENGNVIPTEPYAISSEDGKVAITVPGGWSLYDAKVNEHTLFAVTDPLQNHLCYVDQYLKEEITNENDETMSFDEIIGYLDKVASEEPVTTWTEIADDSVAGKPAKTYEFSNSKGFFVGTIVEDDDRFYTVIVGTSDQSIYNQEVYKTITTSLELKQ